MQLKKESARRYNLILRFLLDKGLNGMDDLLNWFKANSTAEVSYEVIFQDFKDMLNHPEYAFLALMDQEEPIGQGEEDFIFFENRPSLSGMEFLPQLRDKIYNKQVIELYYRPFYEEKPNIIRLHPYLLKEYQSRWYLIGLNDIKKELRTFALDRIIEIKAVEGKYIPRTFNATEFFRNAVGVISSLEEPQEILLEVLKPQAFYLTTQALHSSQYIYSEDEEKIVFAYRLHPSYEFISLVLGLGSDARVLSPDSLVEKVKKQIQATIENYLR
jgi:predicted DNA-binding transcriptional regulator YafY